MVVLAGRARLLAILKPSDGGLLWRTAKADVAHELGLPPQQHHTTTLHFSAIERHFYSRQHAECTSRASSTLPPELLSQAAQGLAGVGRRRLTAAEEKKLLFPLLRLRQACCHPQVGSLNVSFLEAPTLGSTHSWKHPLGSDHSFELQGCEDCWMAVLCFHSGGMCAWGGVM